MKGAFRSDITRDTFNHLNHFSRVLKQQGRVDVDAEGNEEVDIQLYHLHTFIADLVGPRVVKPDFGFQVTTTADKPEQSAEPTQATTQTKVSSSVKGKTVINPDFYIWPGHYYINGLLVENDGCESDTCKIDGPDPCPCPVWLTNNQRNDKSAPVYLVYLDAWERQVTYIEEKSIREVALGVLGPDTTTRAKVEWQVRVTSKMPNGDYIQKPANRDNNAIQAFDKNWQKNWVDALQPPKPHRGMLKAQTSADAQKDTQPCIIPPDSRYRGAENQLYRVEIHNGGPAGTATFKWSRENGSVIFPIIGKVEGNIVKLEHLGRDKRFGLKKDDWVEIVDDATFPQFNPPQDDPAPLFQIDSVDYIHSQVVLKTAPGNIGQDSMKYPILRRWEHYQGDPSKYGDLTPGSGVTVIQESTSTWYTLEDGIQIQFQPNTQTGSQSPSQSVGQSRNTTDSTTQTDSSQKIMYRSGDYWLIPARTATGDVEWPRDDKNEPIAVEPHGVEHYYAPIAFFIRGNPPTIVDLRRTLQKLWNEPAGFPKAPTMQAPTDEVKQEVAVSQSGGQ